jgi:eukaryotic-like serine/threonine-protein kinase
MGEAYLAIHRKLGRKEVLKGILTRRVDSEHVRRFEEEARAATLVQHSNVATLHDLLICADETPVAVWEYIEGESLRQILEREILPVRRAIGLMLQLLDGLSAIHERMLHRDIKPENLMIRPDGQLKIIDFGLAKELGAKPITDAPIGTYHYLAPEAMRMEISRLERTVDIFAAGAVLYEMLTGAPAFQGGSVIQVVYKILNDEPLWIGRLEPDLPFAPMLIAMIKRALAKSPADRYQTAAEFGDDLRGALHHLDTVEKEVKTQSRSTADRTAVPPVSADDRLEVVATAPEHAILNRRPQCLVSHRRGFRSPPYGRIRSQSRSSLGAVLSTTSAGTTRPAPVR